MEEHELCINMLLEPVKVDIKITLTKGKTVRKYSKSKFQFTFLLFAIWLLGEWLLSHFSATVAYWEEGFETSDFESNTIRAQSNTFIRIQDCVFVQMCQVRNGAIFLFINIKRFKGFSKDLKGFSRVLYTK